MEGGDHETLIHMGHTQFAQITADAQHWTLQRPRLITPGGARIGGLSCTRLSFRVTTPFKIIGQDLGLEPFEVQRLMHEGKLTSSCERGVDEDAGLPHMGANLIQGCSASAAC